MLDLVLLVILGVVWPRRLWGLYPPTVLVVLGLERQ